MAPIPFKLIPLMINHLCKTPHFSARDDDVSSTAHNSLSSQRRNDPMHRPGKPFKLGPERTPKISQGQAQRRPWISRPNHPRPGGALERPPALTSQAGEMRYLHNVERHHALEDPADALPRTAAVPSRSAPTATGDRSWFQTWHNRQRATGVWGLIFGASWKRERPSCRPGALTGRCEQRSASMGTVSSCISPPPGGSPLWSLDLGTWSFRPSDALATPNSLPARRENPSDAIASPHSPTYAGVYGTAPAGPETTTPI